MKEIKVGDYIRTKKGKIGKVISINPPYSTYKYDRTSYLIQWEIAKAYYISQMKDIKHGSNIIDLIEVGDYVNGQLVEKIYKKEKDRIYYEFLENEDGSYEVMEMCELKNIKTIVTKELFKNSEYEV